MTCDTWWRDTQTAVTYVQSCTVGHSYTYPRIFLPEWATKLPAGCCGKEIRGDHRLVLVIIFPRHGVHTTQGPFMYAKMFLKQVDVSVHIAQYTCVCVWPRQYWDKPGQNFSILTQGITTLQIFSHFLLHQHHPRNTNKAKQHASDVAIICVIRIRKWQNFHKISQTVIKILNPGP